MLPRNVCAAGRKPSTGLSTNSCLIPGPRLAGEARGGALHEKGRSRPGPRFDAKAPGQKKARLNIEPGFDTNQIGNELHGLIKLGGAAGRHSHFGCFLA